jgi:hypothetical protein
MSQKFYGHSFIVYFCSNIPVAMTSKELMDLMQKICLKVTVASKASFEMQK